MRLRLLPFASLVPLVLASLIAPGCSSSSSEQPTVKDDAGVTTPESKFTVPTKLSELDGDHFFDLPWPCDLRREADGSVRLDGYINPRESKLLQKYQDQLRGKIDGFSPTASGWLTFGAEIDTKTLPADALAATSSTSTLQLVDIDDKSPEKGKRRPIIWRFRAPVGDYYTRPNTLAFMPALGMPLREKTRYAIVATRGLKTTDGRSFQPNDGLQAVLDGKGTAGAAWKGALDALDAAGLPRTQIAHLSIYTTSGPTGELAKIAADVRKLPPPVQTDIAYDTTAGNYDGYTGNYSGSPDYQQGEVPFLSDGGNFVFDASGAPLKQRDFSLRFYLAVPLAATCPMPPAGYPIVLYAHGTGGDYKSFTRDGTAKSLAGQCLASMGIDQIFHGTRPGAPPDSDPNKDSKISLLFFNVENVLAARTNTRQGAVDDIARAHLVASGGLTVPLDVSKSGNAVKFDPTRIGFFGHSQGGLNGPLMFAVDDQTKGGVLSGAGSEISYSVLAKTKPDPSVANLFKALINVSVEFEDEVDELHPFISFVQTVIDPADPVHYYPHIALSPLPGLTPKSVFMTEGVAPDGTGDSYAPPRTIEAGAIAGRFPQFSPVVRDIPELTSTLGIKPVNGPLTGNAAGGKATVALAQFTPKAGRDGHFVVFDIPEATQLASSFCASLLRDEVPTIGNK
jgi:hypothetical protein